MSSPITHLIVFVLGIVFVEMWNNAFAPKPGKPGARTGPKKTQRQVQEGVNNFKKAQRDKIIRSARNIEPSYIEALFIEAWGRLCAREPECVYDLIREYPLLGGKYRGDFVEEEMHCIVELDGMLGHSSPDDVAKDRRRSRELEDAGWRIRRYGALDFLCTDAGATEEEKLRIEKQKSYEIAKNVFEYLKKMEKAA